MVSVALPIVNRVHQYLIVVEEIMGMTSIDTTYDLYIYAL